MSMAFDVDQQCSYRKGFPDEGSGRMSDPEVLVVVHPEDTSPTSSRHLPNVET
jgi:hypothetical protein